MLSSRISLLWGVALPVAMASALEQVYGGFYFVRVMKLHSELFLLNGTILGVSFGTGGGNRLHQQLYCLLFSVLAVVTNKVETSM